MLNIINFILGNIKAIWIGVVIIMILSLFAELFIEVDDNDFYL